MGPLAGLRIIELAGIGPTPFACMWFADMGATVIRIDRQEPVDLGVPSNGARFDLVRRGRRSIALDLKSEAGQGIVRRLAATADVLVEGFRPGVLERLNLTPKSLLAENPKLVIGRMTGFGQEGPLASSAGHDINYIALSGALHAIGRSDGPPVPPLNLVGDYGGGSMFLVAGVLAALLQARVSGKGQVVDAAMVDGATYLMTPIYGRYAAGSWSTARGTNVLDSGAPFYDVYETQDGLWLAVGAIEARFYRMLIEGLGLAGADLPRQNDRQQWPLLRDRFTAAIKSKSLADWIEIFAGTDACVSPVIPMSEVAADAHMAARHTVVERDGVIQPAPAPRFSVTPCELSKSPADIASDTNEILVAAGYTKTEISDFATRGVVGLRRAG